MDFTPQQLECIELLARGELTQNDIGLTIGCTPQCICGWKRQSLFMSAVIDRCRDILKSRLPEIYNVTSNKAAEGNPAHIKILLDHIEKLEEYKSHNSDRTITFTWKTKEIPNE